MSQRIFGVDAGLDRVSARLERGTPLQQVGHRRGCLFDHPGHQIYTEHFLGHTVLYLQTRVHLEEIKLLSSRVVDELHGAGVGIVHAGQQARRGFVQGFARGVRQSGRRRFLDDFLVASL